VNIHVAGVPHLHITTAAAIRLRDAITAQLPSAIVAALRAYEPDDPETGEPLPDGVDGFAVGGRTR
jgi:hypothetical protein